MALDRKQLREMVRQAVTNQEAVNAPDLQKLNLGPAVMALLGEVELLTTEVTMLRSEKERDEALRRGIAWLAKKWNKDDPAHAGTLQRLLDGDAKEADWSAREGLREWADLYAVTRRLLRQLDAWRVIRRRVPMDERNTTGLELLKGDRLILVNPECQPMLVRVGQGEHGPEFVFGLPSYGSTDLLP